MFGPSPPDLRFQASLSATYRHLTRGTRYRVARAFIDHDRHLHPEDEAWTFLGSNFVPYHDGLSLYVSLDGINTWQIRMQCIPEEQGGIVDDLPS